MKKSPKLGLLCLLFSVFLNQDAITAQQVILINGEPTEVILDGDQIQSIVSTQLENYLAAYAQEVDDAFVKTLVKIEAPTKSRAVSQASTISASHRKSRAKVTEELMVLAQVPQQEK